MRIAKKLENHHHAQALYLLYYNFVRLNQAVKMSPLSRMHFSDGDSAGNARLLTGAPPFTHLVS
jgi:hypothetical protein